jgi:Ca2+-binding RTX toxin-like protein
VVLAGDGDDYVADPNSDPREAIDGGNGDDYIRTSGGPDHVIRGGAGNDVLFGGPASSQIGNIDQFGDGIADGGPGNDIVLGGGANDRVTGGDGDDVLYGGGRLDRYDCGPGNDVAFVENSLEGQVAASNGCERVVIGDPSVNDPSFDGLNGAPHPGKATGGR